MADMESGTEPLNQRFDLDSVIAGLASDLEAVRAGRMSIEAARAQADLAKQIFNGVRLVVNAQRMLEGRAKLSSPDGAEEQGQ